LAELCVFEAFLDLGAVAMKMLDAYGGLVVDVGEDEAVAVDLAGVPVRLSRSPWNFAVAIR
jgi:hypothetical protein